MLVLNSSGGCPSVLGREDVEIILQSCTSVGDYGIAYHQLEGLALHIEEWHKFHELQDICICHLPGMSKQ